MRRSTSYRVYIDRQLPSAAIVVLILTGFLRGHEQVATPDGVEVGNLKTAFKSTFDGLLKLPTLLRAVLVSGIPLLGSVAAAVSVGTRIANSAHSPEFVSGAIAGVGLLYFLAFVTAAVVFFVAILAQHKSLLAGRNDDNEGKERFTRSGPSSR